MILSRFFALVLALGSFLVAPCVADDSRSDSAQQLQSAVHRMAFWLGTGENAEAWRQYLLLNHLDTQAALGDRADLVELQNVLARFESGSEGLDHPSFVLVKDNLQRHIQFLANRGNADPKELLAQAKYQPIHRDVVKSYFEQVKSDYGMLQEYYRSNMSSRDRAMLFYDLKVVDAIDLFESTDFDELMPDPDLSDLQIDGLGGDEDSEAKDDEKSTAEIQNEFRKQLGGLSQALNSQPFDLNDPYIAATQLSLDRFARVLFYATSGNTERIFDAELKKIRDNFDSLTDVNQRDKHAIVGYSIGFMESANQMPKFVSLMRAKHSLPNMHMAVSTRLLNIAASRPVNQAQAVNEMLLGRLIRGYAIINGQVTIDTIPDDRQAHFSIRMRGVIDSNTYSNQGPVTAYTNSIGQVEARRSIIANLTGFVATETYSAAHMSSEFLGINLPIRLIEKIAVKTYQRDKDRSEAIGSERVKKQIYDQFDEETNNVLNEGRGKFSELVDKVEPKSKLIPEVFLNTTSTHLSVTGYRANSFDFGAPNQPAASVLNPDVAIQLHETFLTNYFTPFVAGKTVSNEQLADILMEQTGSVPDGLAPESDDDVVSITFPQIQPIRVIFDDQKVTVSITGRRFSQGGRNIRAGLKINLSFRIIRRNGKLLLVRDGDAVIEYMDGRNAQVAAFKNFLEGKLNERGQDNPTLEVELPENLIPLDEIPVDDHDDVLKSMKLVQLSSQAGWLMAGWTHAPGGAPQTETLAIHQVENGE